MTETLLLIEDDVILCNALRHILTLKGFMVEVANDAVTGVKKAYLCKPDAIILDIMLPDSDGWQVCAHIKSMFSIPILILTALGTDEHVVKALELGADDYMVKPVTTSELLERINTLLQRVRRSNRAFNHDRFGCILHYDNLTIDLDRHEVTLDDERVDLSPIEFQLLTVLIRYEGRMLPHEFLLNKIWGSAYANKTNYLRLYINYLRRKLEKDPDNPTLIHNEWGIGYRFGVGVSDRIGSSPQLLSGSQNVN